MSLWEESRKNRNAISNSINLEQESKVVESSKNKKWEWELVLEGRN